MSIVLHFEIEKGEPIDWCNFSARIKLTESSKNYLREKLGNEIKFDNLNGYYDLNPESFHIHYSKNDDRNILHIKDEEGYCLTSNILLNSSVFSVELYPSDGSIIDYGFYPTPYAVRSLDIYKQDKDSSFNDKNQKLLPTTQDILAKLLSNTNKLSVSEVSLQVQNKIDEAIAKEEQEKRNVEEKLMADHAELKELINNDQIVLFKVIKGQDLDSQHTAAVLQLRNTDRYINLDPEKYYIGKEYLIHQNNQVEYLVCKDSNSNKNMYIDYENAFFVLNKSSHHNLQNGFYQIYNDSYGKDLMNGAGYLKDRELPGKISNILDTQSEISEVYKEESTIAEVHMQSSNGKVIDSNKVVDSNKVINDSKIIDSNEVMDSSKVVDGNKVINGSKIIDDNKVMDSNKVIDGNKVMDSNKVIDGNKVIDSGHNIEFIVGNDSAEYKKADKIIEFIQDRDPGVLDTLIKSLKPYGADSHEGQKLIKGLMDYFKVNYELEFSKSLNDSVEKSNDVQEEDSNMKKGESNTKEERSVKEEGNFVKNSKEERSVEGEGNVVENSEKENQSKKLENEEEVMIASVINSMDDTSEHPFKVNKGDPLDVGKYRVELNVKHNDLLNLYNNAINKYQVEKAYNYEQVKVLYNEIAHMSLSNCYEKLITLPEAYITNNHLFIQDYDFGSINNFNEMFYQ